MDELEQLSFEFMIYREMTKAKAMIAQLNFQQGWELEHGYGINSNHEKGELSKLKDLLDFLQTQKSLLEKPEEKL